MFLAEKSTSQGGRCFFHAFFQKSAKKAPKKVPGGLLPRALFNFRYALFCHCSLQGIDLIGLLPWHVKVLASHVAVGSGLLIDRSP